MSEIKSAFNASCLNCGLQKICFPTGLKKNEITRLDRIVERKSPLVKNQHLYNIGETFTTIYAIRSGVIKLYTYSAEGEELIHGFYFPGDVIGFDGMVDGRYAYNAIALQSTSVCNLPYSQLSLLSIEIPSLNQQVLTVMSQEMLKGRMHSELLIRKNADTRVARFIWNMAERHRNKGYMYEEFYLNILHKDVALYLGLTPETVSRILSKLSADNIVSWKKKTLVIHDWIKLKQVSGMLESGSCSECG